MSQPAQPPLLRRAIIAFAIIVFVLLLMALIGWMSGGWDEAEGATPDFYQGIPLDEKLLTLDKRALDEAYHQHIIKLWNIWLTDGAKEATRVHNGLRISRQSYEYAAAQITRREQEIGGKRSP